MCVFSFTNTWLQEVCLQYKTDVLIAPIRLNYEYLESYINKVMTLIIGCGVRYRSSSSSSSSILVTKY
jgi:hypothetical protein